MRKVYFMSLTIREKLKHAFIKSGLTYKQFALRVESKTKKRMTIPSAHRKLNGVTPTTLEEAEVYAGILGVKISATLKKGR